MVEKDKERAERETEVVEIFGKPFRPYRHIELPDGGRRPVFSADLCGAVIEAWKAEQNARKRPS